ncbi:hypothetical protein [Erythrobacter sp. MTPC3]|uniref:hypothetical protein n=1 Tax=Erythrobacter sp. MTPC3 TaxID=3056564 RepID=UPI0036F398A0
MGTTSFVKWKPHLAIGITGHRGNNEAYARGKSGVEAALAALFDTIGAIRAEAGAGLSEIRLHSLLAGGVDQVAAWLANERGWSLIAPLPFGSRLNSALNAEVADASDLNKILNGEAPNDADLRLRVDAIASLEQAAHVFEIADRDEPVASLYAASLTGEADHDQLRRLDLLRSENVALAGRVMIERSDLMIAVWDGRTTQLKGGTGHTILAALNSGTPVLVIDPAAPDDWSILTLPEELGHRAASEGREASNALLRSLITGALAPIDDQIKCIEREKWRATSGFGFGIYRKIEFLFGGRTARSGTLQAQYEQPEKIGAGSGAGLLLTAEKTLNPGDRLNGKLREELLPVFAWADGVSSRLSDAYRSSMSVNFVLSALAIIAGIAYLPLGLAAHKWIFASVELILLLGILAMTFAGLKLAWHKRWFETRRVAEYLRFAPALVLMGIARPVGRWPKGDTHEWPERFSRDVLRDIGLPTSAMSQTYLRTILKDVVLRHVQNQRRYHEAKARQLERAHHRLDKSAEACFLAAVVSVSIYLLLEAGEMFGIVPDGLPFALAKIFTFLGVAFPTLGANLAGIRYFGDFERFSAISSVTAARLAGIEKRIELLLTGDPDMLSYQAASEAVRKVDEIVIGEIEMWQSVFGSKHLALPA